MYSATGRDGRAPDTLTLTAPAGADYTASADAEGLAANNTDPLRCTLSFGQEPIQTIIVHHTHWPQEVVLQGSGQLAGGRIAFACSKEAGQSGVVSNLSLDAYPVSQIN